MERTSRHHREIGVRREAQGVVERRIAGEPVEETRRGVETEALMQLAPTKVTIHEYCARAGGGEGECEVRADE